MVALGLGNPSVSVPRNGERTRPGSLTHMVKVFGAQINGPIRKGITLLTFPFSVWKKLEQGIRISNNELYLPSSWTDEVSDIMQTMKDFHCCLKFKRHFVPKRKLYRFSCTFFCKIPDCKMTGRGKLTNNDQFHLIFDKRNVNHSRKSFCA